MMKNVLVIVTFLLSVVLTGCGSNSKPDGGPNPALDEVLELQEQEILLAPNGTDFSLTMPFRKLIDETYLIELSGFSLEVTGGCKINSIGYTPTTLTFESVEDSMETLYVSGTFDANCTPTGYTLRATQKITRGNLIDTRQVSFSYAYGSGSVNEGYSFYNATTPMEITEAGTQYEIKVQLVKDGYVAVGETIKLQSFDNTYGNITNYEAITGSDGYATFEYTSPETLPASGSSVTLTADYFLEDNTTITPKEIVLNFISYSTTGMELVAVPDAFHIEAAGESRVIDLYLVDTGTMNPVEGQEIKAQFINPNNGTLDKYTGVTDENGHVAFNYTAPELLPVGPLTIIFEIAGNVTDTQQEEVDVTFGALTIPAQDTDDYNLIAVPDTFDIAAPGEQRVLDLYVKDTSTQTPVEGQEIKAQFINPNNGTLDKYTGVTDANGHAVFVYTAPATLPGTPKEIDFELAGNVTNTQLQTVTVNFVTADPLDTSDYNLIPIPSSFYISNPGETRAIDLYVKDTTTQLPIADVEIITELRPTKGTFDKYTAITDANGHVVFNYTAPETLPVSPADFTFQIAENVTNHDSEIVTVNFVTAAPIDTSNMNLWVTLDTIAAYSMGAEATEDIDIWLSDTDGNPIQGIEIRAVFFNPDWGSLDKYTAVTDERGHVVFNYTSPEEPFIADRNIWFEVVNGSPVEQVNVTLDWTP